MNREEALREMRDGAKVRHQHFTREEYLFVIWRNEMRLIYMDPIGETCEFGIEKQISQSQIQNWLQSRQLAQKSALRLSAHEGVCSRWNQSKQGGRPFGKRLQSRRIPRSR